MKAKQNGALQFSKIKMFVVCTKMLKVSEFCHLLTAGDAIYFIYFVKFALSERSGGMHVSQDSFSGFILQILVQNDPDPLR